MHTEQNPTKYRMYLNYDNDRKVYVFPRLPDKIKVTSKGKTASVDIDRFGEVLHKGKRDAITISFSSFSPPSMGKATVPAWRKNSKALRNGMRGFSRCRQRINLATLSWRDHRSP